MDMIYQVSYELRTQNKDYTQLYSFLEKELGSSAIHVQRDTWWIDFSGKDINDVCDEIRNRIGESDIFYLSQLDTLHINGWMPSTTWNWLREHK